MHYYNWKLHDYCNLEWLFPDTFEQCKCFLCKIALEHMQKNNNNFLIQIMCTSPCDPCFFIWDISDVCTKWGSFFLLSFKETSTVVIVQWSSDVHDRIIFMSVKNAINVSTCLVYLQHSDEQNIFVTNFKSTTNSPMLLSADLLSQNYVLSSVVAFWSVQRQKCFRNQPHLPIQSSAKHPHWNTGEHVSAVQLKSTVNTRHNLPGNL